MGKKVDTSILEKYREEYEAGKITQVEIQKILGICKRVFDIHIESNNWNIQLAFQNRIKLKRLKRYEKIEKYKNDYESGFITMQKICKELRIKHTIVRQYVKEQNWNMEANRQKQISIATSNLKPLTKEMMEIGHIANKKRWERLHKFARNRKKDDIVYMNGVAFVWGGFKYNKAIISRAKLMYSKHTYSDTEILKLEQCQKRI